MTCPWTFAIMRSPSLMVVTVDPDVMIAPPAPLGADNRSVQRSSVISRVPGVNWKRAVAPRRTSVSSANCAGAVRRWFW